MSAEFDSRKDSHPTKSKQRPWILVKLSFRVMWFQVIWLCAFDNMTISLKQKRSKVWVYKTPIFEIIIYHSPKYLHDVKT